MARGFVPDRQFEAQMRRDTQVRAELRNRAEDGAEASRRAAPVHTGHYRDTIEVEETVDGYRVVSSDPAASIIEWGSVNNPPYGPLRKGAEESGAHYVDTGPG